MPILAFEIEAPDATAADFARLGRDEAARLLELVHAGVVLETWFHADRDAAVLLLECASVAEAEAHLATLPFVAAGLIRFETIPLRPYPGFARLGPREG